MRKVFFTLAMLAGGFVIAQDAGFFLDDWKERSAEIPAHLKKGKSGDDPSVQISVDGASVLNKVPTYIYGNNAVTWGGNMNLHATVMTDINKLAPNVLRWPGGNLSNQYFWSLSPGDGPEDIPPDIEAQYGMNVADWRMSSPQYYQLLESTGSTGIVCVNYSYARYGTGIDPVAKAAHLAAEWVRYDSGRSKFWEIGNENFGNWQSGYQIDQSLNQDGQPEYINGQLYGRHCKVFLDSMRAAAAEIGVEIKIGVVAYDAETSYDPINTNWNEGMMPEVGDLADFIIVHSYFTPYEKDSPASVVLNSHDVVSEVMEAIMSDMSEAGKPMIPVAFTEWNIFAVRSMQQVSYINGMHAALVLGEFVLNDYGLAARWDLANSWAEGDDHGMFSRGGEPGVDLYNPRPVFFYMYYFQKYFGDRMLSTTVSGNEQIISYASSFSSGETGMVLVNKGTGHETLEISLENLEQGAWYYTMTLTGGDDNGEFSRRVFLNGIGGDEEGGGPDDYENVKAYSYGTRGGIIVDLPALSVVYLMVEAAGDFSYLSSEIGDDSRVIQVELSEDIQPVTDASGFVLKLGDGTEVSINGVARDTEALYQLNLSLGRDILNNDQLTLSYSGSAVLSLVGATLPSFQDEQVSNQLPDNLFEIRLHLSDSHTGASLTGVKVSTASEEDVSGSDGIVSFSLYAGLRAFDMEAFNYLEEQVSCEVESDTLLKIIMERSHARVKFRLRDGAQPVNKAEVEMNSETLVSDQLGQCLFSSVPVRVSTAYMVRRENYMSVEGSVELLGDTTILLQMEKSISGQDFFRTSGNGLKIFPNPFVESLFIQGEGQMLIAIEMLDLTGKSIVMMHVGSSAQVLNLPAGTAPGIYLLKVWTEDELYREKIIVGRTRY